MSYFFGLMLMMASSFAFSEDFASDENSPPRYLAAITRHDAFELTLILERADVLLQDRMDVYPDYPPLTLVLHGDEARFFTRMNYPANKMLVDLAARLDAFHVIDLKICETWMRDNGVKRSELPAFVETVPYGPAEEDRLEQQGYLQF
ncbi:hypothetical protein ACKC9G_08915 [Pokkaliibacter sp. CJK22405]|uniref:DsrE family protein n=1 Tax=Pokkaliibacter sp. CJK22405 TaxID=3384615 RepID=UPI003984978B